MYTQHLFCETQILFILTCINISPFSHNLTYFWQQRKVVSVHEIKAYGGVDLQFHIFLNQHYMEVSGQLHAQAALLQGKELMEPIE